MTPAEKFDQLKNQFDLQEADFFFLDLIPVINMIWADGQNQQGELRLLYQFVIDHIAQMDQHINDLSISVEDANSFLDRFAHRRPNPHLLKALTELFHDHNHPSSKYEAIMEQCLDIAAACTTHYPYELRERVIEQEKQLIFSLFDQIQKSSVFQEQNALSR